MMETSSFNTYYDNIDTHFWLNLCVEKGVLRHYEKGELFAEEGRNAKYLGYIKSGALKYVVYASDGSEKVIGLEMRKSDLMYVIAIPVARRNSRL